MAPLPRGGDMVGTASEVSDVLPAKRKGEIWVRQVELKFWIEQIELQCSEFRAPPQTSAAMSCFAASLVRKGLS
jgi:hypothetical protein